MSVKEEALTSSEEQTESVCPDIVTGADTFVLHTLIQNASVDVCVWSCFWKIHTYVRKYDHEDMHWRTNMHVCTHTYYTHNTHTHYRLHIHVRATLTSITGSGTSIPTSGRLRRVALKAFTLRSKHKRISHPHHPQSCLLSRG